MNLEDYIDEFGIVNMKDIQHLSDAQQGEILSKSRGTRRVEHLSVDDFMEKYWDRLSPKHLRFFESQNAEPIYHMSSEDKKDLLSRHPNSKLIIQEIVK